MAIAPTAVGAVGTSTALAMEGLSAVLLVLYVTASVDIVVEMSKPSKVSVTARMFHRPTVRREIVKTDIKQYDKTQI